MQTHTKGFDNSSGIVSSEESAHKSHLNVIADSLTLFFLAFPYGIVKQKFRF